ncbi:phospholipase D family protein [Ureibacillus sp. 179-F W5.1 NHS]|uniref:phospholipase D family protein n=1 Tax=Ureibacillus sp. 179-F W5.1 NHS TaxID=3374297 RepID=UPI00387A6874
MNTYTENLYNNIFNKIANEYTNLRVISGYGSATFLKRVIEDFPHLSVELFLGMASEGVSINNHVAYQKFTKSEDKVNVYYQISKPLNHMKILEFSNSTAKTLLAGSANFTENGFLIQRELMSTITDNLDSLFEEQRANSLICIDPTVEQYISFYKEDTNKGYITEVTKLDKGKQDVVIGMNNLQVTPEQVHHFKQKMLELSSRVDFSLYTTFEISVVLKSEHNPMWSCKGINAWTIGKEPVLEQTPRLSFDKVFPKNKEFTIFTDDNQTFRAKLTGNFNGQLTILNCNLYDYICNRISLTQKRPISYDDLVAKNCTTMYFKRINEIEYCMSFNKDYLTNK